MFDAGAGDFSTGLNWRGDHVESGGSRMDLVLLLIVLVLESRNATTFCKIPTKSMPQPMISWCGTAAPRGKILIDRVACSSTREKFYGRFYQKATAVTLCLLLNCR